jgi:CheY-like chemotaxis protein
VKPKKHRSCRDPANPPSPGALHLENEQLFDAMTRTVLVVEDEIFIRLDISDYLREHGFDVLEAANARDAMHIVERGTPIDLVFTDVHLPGQMDGLALARFLEANHPEIKIVVTYGHIRSCELPEGFGPLVDKPYERGQIVERIRNALLE